MKNTHTTSARSPAYLAAVTGVSLMAMMWSQPALAQVTQADNGAEDDEVVVVGTRQVIQDSIVLKRQSTQIVDGLSADEIGDIPALSIGEALESITGVASHRENGGATEVSVRGLGPYLSSTVVNGRAATNGSGDRSVNFSQFPSELMNKLAVFKTQDASQIEGGVAGQIQLETLRPLDYGKTRAQFDIKANANPDQFNQDDTQVGDLGYRLTGSYVDQFQLGTGDFGFSIGVQTSDISQPEAESRQTSSTSSSRPACLLTQGLTQYTDATNGGTFTGFSGNPETRDRGDDDCDDFNDRRNSDNLDTRGSDTEGYDVTIDPNTGLAIDAGTPIAFAPSQRHFRQNDTRDRRDAIFTALQWAPNDRWDINLDAQYSERTLSELRNDLTFNGGRRNDSDLEGRPGGFTTTFDSLVLTPQGGILRSVSENTIEVQGGDFEREEKYLGGGLNISHDVTERLKVTADLGYSSTERTENAIEFRIQSDITPIIEFDRRGAGVNSFNIYDDDFDVNDHDNYVDRLRVRVDNDSFRDNEIFAGRLDAEYALNAGIFNTLKAGVRFANQDYLELPGGIDSGNPLSALSGRFSFEIENDGELTVNNREVIDDSNEDANERIEAIFDALQDDLVAIIGNTNSACRTLFPEDDFLSSARNGDLVTVIGDDGQVLSSTNSWATFDASCIANTAVDSLNSLLPRINAYLLDPDETEGSFEGALGAFSALAPALEEQNLRTIDVQEQTTAFYAMTEFETELGNMPFSGNIGARIVKTDVESTGYRRDINVNNDGGELSASFGDLVTITEEHDYTRFLPSAIGILEIAPDKLVRAGIFRAMSRPDPSDMGFGRSFQIQEGDDDNPIETLDDLIGQNVSADGNPSFDPLMSWNYDLGFEWYPNDDSILALAGYYKSFQGGFVNTRQVEDFNIGGETISRTVAVPQTSDEKSDLFGLEFTGSHSFSYLPGLLSGLGAKVSYNYVDSDFEFEDSRYGDAFEVQTDGTVIQLADGVIAPGGLPGLSEHTLSATGYYQIGDFDFQLNYKYRSDYFQPFVSNGTRLRFVGDVGVWEARASYYINDNFRVSLEAINLGSEPKNQFAYVTDDLYEVNDYGPRVFLGLRGRF